MVAQASGHIKFLVKFALRIIQFVFEELKKDIPTEKAEVDLKILLKHLKYVFL